MLRRIRVAHIALVVLVVVAVGGPATGAGAVRAAGAVAASTTRKVPVTLREFVVRPKRDFVRAGTTVFVTRNAGTEVHELVLARLRDGRPLPLDPDGAVDEDAISVADAIGEAEDIAPRRTASLKAVALTPGTYELFCNIVEQEDGETVSHYARGMHTLFVVE